MNTATALQLAAMIQVAYAQYRGTTAALPPGLVIEETLTAHENGVQVPFGFIASLSSPVGSPTVCVVIRGTCSLLEWLGDGFIIPARFPGYGNVAGGFNGIYRELAAQIIKTLKRICGSSTKIYVTGHSLGAALAHLAAADILLNLSLLSESFTFCGPRCGDLDFANAFKAASLVTWRVFNTEDIVPTIPWATSNASLKIPGLVDRFLSLFDRSSGEFEHIGTPIAVTFQRGSLEANHDLSNLVEALQ